MMPWKTSLEWSVATKAQFLLPKLVTKNKMIVQRTMLKKIIVCLFTIHHSLFTVAQDTVHYTGNTVVNVDYHNGQLPLAMGVHSVQLMRANRQNPTPENGYGWTYNHAPMMCYWNNQFFVEYLSDSIGESVPPGRTLLMHSKDGQHWSAPTIIFPKYRIPDGTTKKNHPGVAKDLDAVMHQRMGFYTAKSKRLLVLGFYGICLDGHDDPNDGEGIGRVVREVLPNGDFGPIYFIHYNPAWNEKNTSYPFYKTSKDQGFVQACDELMANPLMMMQWVEETDRADPLIPLHKDYKAFNFYHLNDGRVVGLWKNALTSISKDGGKTWPNAVRAPKFVNSNAKIWGQKTSDGKYATVYNPSEFRWPLGISTSADGLNYTNLLLVNGEISGMRYGGAYKSYGPQYVRGIIKGNGTPPDKNMWVTYSMNKEDIWVSSIPVPVKDKAEGPINDVFNDLKDGEELNNWNTFSPVWAQVSMEKMKDGTKALSLKDADLFDYAKAEHLFPETKKVTIEFSVTPMQYANSNLQVEVQDAKGTPCTRLIFSADSAIYLKVGYRLKRIGKYKAGEESKIKLVVNTDQRMLFPTVDGKEGGASLFFAPLESVQKITFRTGDTRKFPDAETPTDQNYDVPKAGEKDVLTQYFIRYVKTN